MSRRASAVHAASADDNDPIIGPIVLDDLFDTRAPISETWIVARIAVVRLGAVAVAVGLVASPVRVRADIRTAEHTAPSEPFVLPERALVVDPARAVGPDTVAPAPPAPGELLDERVHAGRHWRLDTPRGAVHIWAPADYEAETAATVVFVHGYWVGVDEAWDSYRLAEQFALSGINALFIVPEAPAAKWEPIAWPSLADLLRTVAERIDVAMPAQRLVAVGHSGAYRTLALWLTHPALDTVVLLDALYCDYGLLGWVRASKQRRLVNIVYETGRFSEYLHRRLPGTVRVGGLPADGLPDARIVYVRTGAGHWELVTEGVALPLALRAIDVPRLGSAPDLPPGLPPRELAPDADDAVPLRLLQRGAEFTP